MEELTYKAHSDIVTGPYQVTIDITNKCNLRCMHCFNFSGENNYINDELTDDEVISLINDLCNMKLLNICICGGEPLLRKDLVIKIAKILNDNGTKCSMVTNGILLDDNTAHQLKIAGIDRVQISIDGIGKSHDKLRGVKGAYNHAINAIKNLQKYNIPTGIAFSPTKWNIDEFLDVLQISLENCIKELRIQALMPIGRGEKNSEEIIPSITDYRKLMKYINVAKKMTKGSDLIIEWGDPIDHLIRLPGKLYCTSIISIRANGNITPSVYLPISFGNIRNHTFQEYWNAGLGKVWTLDILKQISDKYTSVNNMNTSKYNLPKTFIDNDIYIDIIDEEIFK